MDQPTTITEALKSLGVNPALTYALTSTSILLACCRRTHEAAGLLIMLSIPYVSALTLTGYWDRVTLYIPLTGALLSVIFIILPVTFLGKDKYNDLIYAKIPTKIAKMLSKRGSL